MWAVLSVYIPAVVTYLYISLTNFPEDVEQSFRYQSTKQLVVPGVRTPYSALLQHLRCLPMPVHGEHYVTTLLPGQCVPTGP